MGFQRTEALGSFFSQQTEQTAQQDHHHGKGGEEEEQVGTHNSTNQTHATAHHPPYVRRLNYTQPLATKHAHGADFRLKKRFLVQ